MKCSVHIALLTKRRWGRQTTEDEEKNYSSPAPLRTIRALFVNHHQNEGGYSIQIEIRSRLCLPNGVSISLRNSNIQLDHLHHLLTMYLVRVLCSMCSWQKLVTITMWPRLTPSNRSGMRSIWVTHWIIKLNVIIPTMDSVQHTGP